MFIHLLKMYIFSEIKIENIKRQTKNLRNIYTPTVHFCKNTNNKKLETNNKYKKKDKQKVYHSNNF